MQLKPFLGYLRQVLVQLSLKRISLLFKISHFLLLILQGVHESVPLVQHGADELISELRGTLRTGVF